MAIDKMKLTGVQWQFTITAGATNACMSTSSSTASALTSQHSRTQSIKARPTHVGSALFF